MIVQIETSIYKNWVHPKIQFKFTVQARDEELPESIFRSQIRLQNVLTKLQCVRV